MLIAPTASSSSNGEYKINKENESVEVAYKRCERLKILSNKVCHI